MAVGKHDVASQGMAERGRRIFVGRPVPRRIVKLGRTGQGIVLGLLGAQINQRIGKYNQSLRQGNRVDDLPGALADVCRPTRRVRRTKIVAVVAECAGVARRRGSVVAIALRTLWLVGAPWLIRTFEDRLLAERAVK